MTTTKERAARYAEVVARNHARLAALRDLRSGDMFHQVGGPAEALTLMGETMPERVSRATADIDREEPEQGLLF
jgi:hypothetical protein